MSLSSSSFIPTPLSDTEMMIYPTSTTGTTTSTVMMTENNYNTTTNNEDENSVFITTTTTTTTDPHSESRPSQQQHTTTATTGAITTTTTTISPPSFHSSTNTMSTSSTTRHDTFTEAVPLSLSSMAHLNIPLTEGVVDGVIQVIHHTLIQCTNYIRLHYQKQDASSSDIGTTPYAWMPIKDEYPNHMTKNMIPHVLQRMNFVHLYSRNAFIYMKSKLPSPTDNYTKEMEEEMWKHAQENDWNDSSNNNNNNNNNNNGILGRIRLFYCCPEQLTSSELNGDDDDDDDDDIPPCILYQMMVEYCCIPPTGNVHAVQAEELSMLSFGSGTIDDDIKYGALASLYDELAKYVLEIYSIRGKKYKFDLMDSTLSSGTIPHTLTTMIRNNNNNNTHLNANPMDPFLKNLCVTVTDYQFKGNDEGMNMQNDNNNDNNNPDITKQQQQQMMTTGTTTTSRNQKTTSAITRIHLTLEGKLHTGRANEKSNNRTSDTTGTTTSTMITTHPILQDIPAFDYLKNVISYAFLRLNPNPSDMVQAHPSGHTLLLDPDVAGHIYINGRYAMTWGDDNGISASHGTALFGVDLHSIPFWNGRITNYELVKDTYAQVWYEILIDAKLQHLNIANKLLHRLMKGVDPTITAIEEDNDTDLYDDTEDVDVDTIRPDVHQDCLESIVLSAPHYDRVGIAAKALATRFAIEFGNMAFPCLAHETEWVKRALPDREPIVVVPQRLINILRRGGYFDIQKTADIVWFSDSRPLQTENELEIVDIAVRYLEEAGCTDVDAENIVLISNSVADNVVAKDMVCRYDGTSEQFFVHEDYFTSSVNDLMGTETTSPQRVKGYLLGMYIAKAHPVGFGKVLARYLIRNKL